jgi:hypothetical protein
MSVLKKDLDVIDLIEKIILERARAGFP